MKKRASSSAKSIQGGASRATEGRYGRRGPTKRIGVKPTYAGKKPKGRG